MDPLPCLSVLVGPDLRTRSVNSAASHWLVGCSDDPVGRPLCVLVGPAAYAALEPALAAALEGIPQQVSQSWTLPDGRTLATRWDVLPTATGQAAPSLQLLVSDDTARDLAEALTERTRATAELQDNILQNLFAVGLTANLAKLSAERAPAFIDAIVDCVQDAIGDLRRSIQELSVPVQPLKRETPGPTWVDPGALDVARHHSVGLTVL